MYKYIPIYFHTKYTHCNLTKKNFVFAHVDKQSDPVWKKSPKCICHY